jgi:probable HAF family extracellular repeat protein
VGYSGLAKVMGSGTKAFVYYKGQIFALPTPSNVTGSQAFGINNRNQIVGSYTTQSASSVFLYSNGVFIDLNQLLPAGSGWDLASAVGINDAGQIVGIGYLNGNFGQGDNLVYLMDISGLK